MKDETMIFSRGFTTLLIVFLALFFYGVYRGVQISNKEYESCKSKGGVPITERGVYKACMKPEQFIELPK